ncbi:endonuclease/exonuclease/phosphatase [Actinomadura craniellae]|uniref:Endonuclease/exonuclease/phosphatase n=1 Tax=Actinomadura craniellae TaxID=2231787 RepID=A0A365H3F0_9ACTN|nr:endonuclease/exonuclease/phosphatase [Actinomadura craniellae]
MAETGHRIHDVQGAGHRSPLAGARVAGVPGVVTAVTGNGFWMQDPRPDRHVATSEGVFVFTRTRPAVAVADSVRVDGRVGEFRAAGAGSADLGRTEIDATATRVLAHGAPLPAPIVLGPGGRRPPDRVIDGGSGSRDMEASGRFDPAGEGADFYESLEGMLLALDDAVAVGPRSQYGEVPVVPAAGAGVRTRRGGIAQRTADPNPERVILAGALAGIPPMNVGDRLAGRTGGVLDYGRGEFRLLPTASPRVLPGGLRPEHTREPRPDELAVATVNLQDLDPDDPPWRFASLARGIAGALRSPDLICVQEVQDNSGPHDDGTVADDQTVSELIAAISAAGGPAYEWRSIDPRDGADGGESGGNARVGFLFRTDRGLAFTDRPDPAAGPSGGGVAAVVRAGGKARLRVSPGMIGRNDPVWAGTRKPLAGEFTWRGRPLIAVANHWSTASGDDPLYGRYQPPRRFAEFRRERQAQAVARFVRSVRTAEPGALVVVAGDLNSTEDSPPLRALTGGTGLVNPLTRLPLADRYTHLADGNSRALDHVLLSPALAGLPHEVDAVHMNAEFAAQSTDHDPVVVRIRLD